MLSSKLNPFYGPHILFDVDGAGGGGGDDAPGDADQTNWKAKYESLKTEINNDYVPRKSYTSLQQTLQQAHDAKAEKEALALDAQTKLAEVQTQFEATSSQLEQLTATATEKEQLAAQLQARQERISLILKDYPGLAVFEGQGLIPDAPPEELPDLLQKFQENLGKVQEESKTNFKKGETPPEPPAKQNDGTKTSKVLLAEATKLQNEFKFDDYEKKMNEYYAALDRESKAS